MIRCDIRTDKVLEGKANIFFFKLFNWVEQKPMISVKYSDDILLTKSSMKSFSMSFKGKPSKAVRDIRTVEREVIQMGFYIEDYNLM